MNVYPFGFTPCDAALAILHDAGVSVTTESDSDALWLRFDVPDLATFPKLRYILCAATGTEHIDPPPGVRVLSLRDVPAGELDKVTATAELTVGLILELLRGCWRAIQDTIYVRDNLGYPAFGAHLVKREYYIGRSLGDKLVLIVGLGRVGNQVFSRLRGFGCKMQFYDPRYNFGELDSKLPHADIVTVHASLNDTSRGMFDARRFALMKPGALFVNTARGQIVDDDALCVALESGHLAGAATDFPLSRSTVPANLIETPHIGGCTHEAMAATECMIARRFVEEIK